MTADSEKTKFRGRLAEKEDARRKLAVKIEARRDSLRDCLDPFERPEDLPAERIAALGVELSDLIIRYTEVLAEISAIKKALGAD